MYRKVSFHRSYRSTLIEKGEYTSKQFMQEMLTKPMSVIFCPQYYIVKKEIFN